MNTDIAISVKNVSKTFRIPHEKVSSLRGAFTQALKGKTTYEEFKALDGVSFEVKKGEFFGIIGRNGSGKSTLLKVLAGIYQADKGTVHIDGLISPFLELGIGFNPELSGRDNVYLNATVLGLTQKEIDAKFEDIVRFSELERFIDQKLKNYSSGMQVRLAFSVSIHANRDILLMDEVLAVGDSNFQSKCLEEFNKYREMGRTVILVSHDISTIQRYCDRAMLLRNGKIKMIGKADEVTNEYISENAEDEGERMNERDEKRNRNEEDSSEGGKKFDRNVAEILEMSILNKNKKEKNVFRSGERMIVRVLIEFKKEVSDPIFGIIISDSGGKSLFVTNTFLKKMKTGFFKVGTREVYFILENVLSNGTYFISPAIADKDVKYFFDWKNELRSFGVVNEYLSNGVVDLEHEIIIK